MGVQAPSVAEPAMRDIWAGAQADKALVELELAPKAGATARCWPPPFAALVGGAVVAAYKRMSVGGLRRSL